MTNTSWTFVGDHPEDLADGRMVSPGSAPVSLNAEDPHNAAMIEKGVLIPNSDAAERVAEKLEDADEAAPTKAPVKGRNRTSEDGSK